MSGHRPRPRSDNALARAERRVAATVVRLGGTLALRAAVWALAAWTALWGGLLLALRAGLGWSGPPPRWGIAGSLVVVAAAAVLGWRRRPAAALVRDRFESVAACGGLLLAAGEAELGDWSTQLPELGMPRLRWRGGRALLALTAAAAFTTAAGLVPVASPVARGGLDLSHPAAQLARRLDLLAALDQPVAEWRQELGKATDLAAAGEADRAWQAIDALGASLDEAQRLEADAALAAAERLNRAAAAAATREPMPGARGAADAPPSDGAASVEARGGGGETASATLAARLRQRAGAETRLAAALAAGSALDLASLERTSGLDERALAELLADRGGQAAPREESYGRGGVDRGRGDAPYMVKEPSNNWDLGFRDQALPPAALGTLDDSIVLSTDAARPRAGAAQGSAGGALGGARAAGGAAFTGLVLPRHRAAVRRYFVRP